MGRWLGGEEARRVHPIPAGGPPTPRQQGSALTASAWVYIGTTSALGRVLENVGCLHRSVLAWLVALCALTAQGLLSVALQLASCGVADVSTDRVGGEHCVPLQNWQAIGVRLGVLGVSCEAFE